MLSSDELLFSTTSSIDPDTFEDNEIMMRALEYQEPQQLLNTERTSSSLQAYPRTTTRNSLPPSFFTRPNSITIYRKRLFQREDSPLSHCEADPETLPPESAPVRMTLVRQLGNFLGRLKPRTSSPVAEKWIKEHRSYDFEDEFTNRIMPERTRWEEVERHIDWSYYTQSSSSKHISREDNDWENESDWSRRRSLESNNYESNNVERPSPIPHPTFYLKNYDWSRGERVKDGDWEEPRAEYWEKIEFVWQKDGLITSKIMPRPCCDVDDDFY